MGLFFAGLCTGCIHVELITNVNLNNFLLSFFHFTNFRWAVDTMFFDDGFASKVSTTQVYKLLNLPVPTNSLLKNKFVPLYAPGQAGRV